MQGTVLLCSAVFYYAVQCFAMQWEVLLCSELFCYAMQIFVLKCSGFFLKYFARKCSVLYAAKCLAM